MSVAVEGETDLVAARRLLESSGIRSDLEIVCRGKTSLDQRLAKYATAARRLPWFVLRDLDRDAPCASDLVLRRLGRKNPPRLLCFRVAVRSLESWILADRGAFADFLGVSPATLPERPDLDPAPKERVVTLARRSRNRVIRLDLVPGARDARRVGPGYSGQLSDFIARRWSPQRARHASPSLDRCLNALARLATL